MKNSLRILLAMIVFAALCMTANAAITPISEVRLNDETGTPNLNGSVVTLTGTVTVGNELSNPAYIQDATGGVAVYDSKFAKAVKIGDSVVLTGTVTQYRGLTEIGTVTSYNVIASGKSVEPKVVSITDILGQHWDGVEAYEGMLIRVNGISLATTSPTGKWTAATNYQITDGTNTTYLRAESGVDFIGLNMPQASFDVIGVLGYYTAAKTAPWSDPTGYQILPRFAVDILSDLGPVVMPPVKLTSIKPAGFTAVFSTARQGSTGIKYGTTIDMTDGDIHTPDLTLDHMITVGGLQPSTKYYFAAYSANDRAVSTSDVGMIITPSDDPSQGSIKVYFNGTVDNTVAIPGNEAEGSVRFADKLIALINSASYSIDLAIYSLDNALDISNAVLAAKDRGVKIRAVVDHDFNTGLIADWTSKGISISRRADSIMHNKFIVIDARDENKLNDYVWTGSWNLSSANTDLAINNVLVINDYALAQAYTAEFQEMFGSTDETANSANAKFGALKTDNTQHYFSIGGRDVSLFFSPSDATEARIQDEVKNAESTIWWAQYSFTSSNIGIEITNRRNAGVTLRGIFDDTTGSQAKYYHSPDEMFDYRKIAPAGGIIHHKYGIIDASVIAQNPTVITGSHNWTYSANTRNDENTLIIKDVLIANKFMQEFKHRYNDFGATGTFTVPNYNSVEYTPTGTIALESGIPNPALDFVSFKVSGLNRADVSVEIVNSLGTSFGVRSQGSAVDNAAVIDVNISDLQSGRYFAVITAGTMRIVAPFVTVK